MIRSRSVLIQVSLTLGSPNLNSQAMCQSHGLAIELHCFRHLTGSFPKRIFVRVLSTNSGAATDLAVTRIPTVRKRSVYSARQWSGRRLISLRKTQGFVTARTEQARSECTPGPAAC